jgi:transposase
MPLIEALQARMFATERLHADDTPVPVLDTSQTRTAGRGLMCATTGRLPMQADALCRFQPAPPADMPAWIDLEAACWAHARHKFFDLGRLTRRRSPSRRYPHRRAVRHRARHQWPGSTTAPVPAPGAQPTMVEALANWLREQYARLSPNSHIAKAITYSLNGWDALHRFLDASCLCLSNNAAERGWPRHHRRARKRTFAGSDEGAVAAAVYSLIETAKLNDIDPLTWLADVLGAAARPSCQAGRPVASMELEHHTAAKGCCVINDKLRGHCRTLTLLTQADCQNL